MKDGELSKPGERKDLAGDRELANTYSRTMMSAKLLRLQTTEEGQAGFGAEQLKMVLNAFFKVRSCVMLEILSVIIFKGKCLYV